MKRTFQTALMVCGLLCAAATSAPAQDVTSSAVTVLGGVRRGGAPPQSTALPILFRDTFTATTGTANAGRRPYPDNNVSAVWKGSTAWTIRGNHAEPPSGYADGDTQYLDARSANFTFAATMTGFHGGSNATKSMPGMKIRIEDSNNYLLLQFDPFLNTATLYDCTAGVFTALNSGVGPGAGLALPVTVTADGPLITVAVPGQVPFQATTSAHLKATLVGLRAGKSTGTPAGQPQFDDVTVLPLLARDGSNPQIVRGAAGTWEAGDVAAPGMSYDYNKARFVRLYSGYDTTRKRWCTGAAFAPTPTAKWTKGATNPRMCPTAGEGYIAASASKPVYKNGVWYKVYQGAPNASHGNPATPWRVYAASSNDGGVTWTRMNGGAPVLPLGAAGTFDATGQHDPDLRLLDNGWFEVGFSGRDASGVFTAGRALSRNMTTWTTTQQLAVLGGFGAVSANGILNVAFVGTDPLKYGLLYCHQIGSARWIALSLTTDGGATWMYFPGVLFKKGAGWESAQVFDPDALVVADKLYVSYSGAALAGGTEGMGSDIGLASLTIPTKANVGLTDAAPAPLRSRALRPRSTSAPIKSSTRRRRSQL